MKTLPLILLLALAVGCQTTGNNNVLTTIRLVAYNGTLLALIDNPEARPKFEAVHRDLTILEQASAIDLKLVLSVVQALPVEELKSEKARAIMGSVILMFSDYSTGLPSDQLDGIRAAITALREGVELGLQLSIESPSTNALSQPMLRKL